MVELKKLQETITGLDKTDRLQIDTLSVRVAQNTSGYVGNEQVDSLWRSHNFVIPELLFYLF